MKEKLNELKHDELLDKRDQLRKRFRELRFDQVMGHVENPLEIRMVRRQIARLNNIIHEHDTGMRKA